MKYQFKTKIFSQPY